MREILFRGKCLNGDGWVYGDLSYNVHNKFECYVFPGDGYNSPDCYEVDPATVDQYTGLQDKNGKKIFEGDIVKYTSTVCPEDTTTGKVEMYHGSWALLDGMGLISIGQCNPKSLRVIGNVHDNPNCWR